MRRTSVLAFILASQVTCLVTFTAPAAHAVDKKSKPFPGMELLHRSVAGTLNLNALSVDLCAPGIAVRATAPAEKGKTVSGFGAAIGAEAVVNGDFFNLTTKDTSGLAIGKGIKWPNSKNDGFESSVAFGPDRAEIIPAAQARNPGAWVTDLVSSRPQILAAGVIKRGFSAGVCAGATPTAAGDCPVNPRTGIGLSADKRMLYLVVVDGRSDLYGPGYTTYQLAKVMQELGASDAISMDGGGSSAMWIKGKGVVSHPSDGNERVVANHLAVQAGGTEPPRNCNLTAADAGAAVDAGAAGLPAPETAGGASSAEGAAGAAKGNTDGEDDGNAATDDSSPQAGCSAAPVQRPAPVGLALLAFAAAFRRWRGWKAARTRARD